MHVRQKFYGSLYFPIDNVEAIYYWETERKNIMCVGLEV